MPIGLTINQPERSQPLDELPLPARHLLDGDAYFNPLTSLKVTSLMPLSGIAEPVR